MPRNMERENDQAAAEDDEPLLPLPLDLVEDPDELDEDVDELVEDVDELEPFDDPEPLAAEEDGDDADRLSVR
jgi:hypothetical protein